MSVQAHVGVAATNGGAPDLQRLAEVAHHLESLTFEVLERTSLGWEVRVDARVLEALLGATLPLPAGGACDLTRLSTALSGLVEDVHVHPELYRFSE